MIGCTINSRIFIALLIVIGLSKTIVAQTRLDPEVISSTGQHLESSSVKLDYTLGEFMVRNVKGSAQITQGFQQGTLSLMIPVTETSFNGKIEIFPNPVSSGLTISIYQEGTFVVTLHDMLGIKFFQQEFSTITHLDLEKLIPGNYGIMISAEGVPVYTSILEKTK